MHSVQTRLGPADRVTMLRALLAVGVAGLTVASWTRPVSVATLVAVSSVALALDWVDGQVARRTGTESEFGARFDMEVDAFLILVLSVYVVSLAGPWVLAIGTARYVFVAAGWFLPWLREKAPARPWCKVVAAVQGVVLTVVAADVVPHAVAVTALVAALVLLAESFGREAWWLWRHRRQATGRVEVPSAVLTVPAALLVWFALVAPHDLGDLGPEAFLRLPLEGLVVTALLLVLPVRASRVVAVLAGFALALLTILKVLDLGFSAVLDRPFDPVSDWTYFGPAVGVLADSSGQLVARASAVGALLLVVAVLVLTPLAVVHLAHLASRRRRTSLRTVIGGTAAWAVLAAAGAAVPVVGQLASVSAAGLAYDEVTRVRASLHDRQVFEREIGEDAFAGAPADRLLTGLRGKDVLVVFVESYGRVAVEGSDFAPGVDAVLDDGTRRLEAAGWSSRSAFLTSPTFGAASWLAHSTLQSGLWVDSQRRYDQLLGADRLTLTGAFGRAGWRTVFDDPAITRDWPEGEDFYHFDESYDSRNVGYQGPAFSYATMPDQYSLAFFRQRELLPADRPPVMAEIDLISSHHPWTPLPHLIGWDEVGDGSVFAPMPDQGDSPDEVFRDPERVREAYGRSIEYSLTTLVSFLETYPDPNLVLVVLGDHQPHHYVSGDDPGHDVPISVIAQDPQVIDRISSWGWHPGLRPPHNAPVWPMDSFRDRFLTAFGPHRD